MDETNHVRMVCDWYCRCRWCCLCCCCWEQWLAVIMMSYYYLDVPPFEPIIIIIKIMGDMCRLCSEHARERERERECSLKAREWCRLGLPNPLLVSSSANIQSIYVDFHQHSLSSAHIKLLYVCHNIWTLMMSFIIVEFFSNSLQFIVVIVYLYFFFFFFRFTPVHLYMVVDISIQFIRRFI